MNEAAQQSAKIIGARCPFESIDIALIVGDELQGVTDVLAIHDRVAYDSLPGFPIGAGMENGAVVDGALSRMGDEEESAQVFELPRPQQREG